MTKVLSPLAVELASALSIPLFLQERSQVFGRKG